MSQRKIKVATSLLKMLPLLHLELAKPFTCKCEGAGWRDYLTPWTSLLISSSMIPSSSSTGEVPLLGAELPVCHLFSATGTRQ